MAAQESGFDFDFVIVGSGFGGSVAALRLAEKGYRVCVLERGRRFADSDFARTNWDLRRYLWLPALRCFGIQKLTPFKDVFVLSGAGVGGGSLVYANTLFQPGDEFFRAPVWKDLADWKAELEPHYATARRMLGVATNPRLGFVDRALQEVADETGRGGTFRASEVGVYFGEPGETVPDPYFGGLGPERTGCIHCGGCMVGCRHGAKNTLVKNYLHLAERRGARVLPEREVTDVRALGRGDGGDGYEIHAARSTAWFGGGRRRERILARQVVLSGGVLGTLSLLFRCKEVTGGLPRVSERLGHDVRTNSESLLGVTQPGPLGERDYSEGVAITSIFHPDEHTHIEPVRYPRGSGFMRLLAAPMRLQGALRAFFQLDWARRTSILLVMQSIDSRLRLSLGRGPFTLFRRGLVSRTEPGSPPLPLDIPAAHDVVARYARKLGGVPQRPWSETLLRTPMTAHVLGGCPIGADAGQGVVDSRQRVFGYQGLYVCDGSTIPANLGVNPSLTITAMTERVMQGIPASARKTP